MLCLPSGYSTEWPGPTQNVLGESGGEPVITVQGAPTHQDSGRLLLVTVSAMGIPGYPVTGAQTLWAWLDPSQVVLPREAVVPAGETSEEYDQKTTRQMTTSQHKAADAALSFMRRRGMDVPDDVKVIMHVDEIGGPSAGLMYTLGLIDKLTPIEESGGQTIAGTGTMSRDGRVGSIGGIRLKMLGARRDGASWFLAPAANCDEVTGHVPDGLRDVRVSTLAEAYDALVAIGQGNGQSLPHCTAGSRQ